MTNSYSNSTTENQTPLFREFKWHNEKSEHIDIKGGMYTNLAGLAKDVASGCNTVLELVEFNYLNEVNSEKPIFHPYQVANLLRLAAQSLKMLEKEADEGLDWIHDKTSKELEMNGGNS